MRKVLSIAAALAASAALIPELHAKLPSKIEQALLAAYPPAEAHHALESARMPPDPAKLRGFVVLERGGVPAERARFFVNWEEYDYRGAVVDVAKGGDALTTRRGKVYTYLQNGDVLAVAGLKDFNRTIYLKLLTPDVYVPEERRGEKRHSRVTVMLGFQFPREVFRADDAEAVMAKLGEWLKPFPDVDAAKAYASSLRAPPAVAGAEAEAAEAAKGRKGKKGKKGKMAAAVPPEAAAPAEAAPNVNDREIEDLERKIEEARRQMEEAERQVQEIKRSRQKGK